MRNLRLEIEYDGARFAGWQVQNHTRRTMRGPQRTVQETIEKVLRRLLREKIQLIVSGRTDAGVHAISQVANFKTSSKLSIAKLRFGLNALLPADISVSRVSEVDPAFHSRFSARSKIYRYRILNRPSPSALSAGRAFFHPQPLDLALMRRQASVLLGRHDFSAFCASASGVKNKVRTVKNILLKKKKGGFIELEIEADGFLYNMVRNIAGTLIAAGRGRLRQGDVRRILRSRDRRLAGPTAPAEGLYLVRVKY